MNIKVEKCGHYWIAAKVVGRRVVYRSGFNPLQAVARLFKLGGQGKRAELHPLLDDIYYQLTGRDDRLITQKESTE